MLKYLKTLNALIRYRFPNLPPHGRYETISTRRYRTIIRLGELAHSMAVPLLVNILQDDKYIPHRREAAEALGLIKSDKAINALINALKDQEEQVRKAAIVALGRIGSPDAVVPICEAIAKNRVHLFDGICALGAIRTEESLSTLVRLTADYESEYVIWRIPGSISSFANDSAEAALLEMIESQHVHLRVNAILALKGFTSSLVTDRIIIVLEDPLPEMRSAAIQALCERRNKSVTDAICKLLTEEKDGNVIFSFCESIDLIGDSMPREFLSSILPKIYDAQDADKTGINYFKLEKSKLPILSYMQKHPNGLFAMPLCKSLIHENGRRLYRYDTLVTARAAVAALDQTLQQCPKEIPVDILRTISNFQDIEQIENYEYDGWLTEDPVCLSLEQLRRKARNVLNKK